jgi:hypothetical protein
MPFQEVVTVYSENHLKPVNTLCVQKAEMLIVEAGGIYGYS